MNKERVIGFKAFPGTFSDLLDLIKKLQPIKKLKSSEEVQSFKESIDELKKYFPLRIGALDYLYFTDDDAIKDRRYHLEWIVYKRNCSSIAVNIDEKISKLNKNAIKPLLARPPRSNNSNNPMLLFFEWFYSRLMELKDIAKDGPFSDEEEAEKEIRDKLIETIWKYRKEINKLTPWKRRKVEPYDLYKLKKCLDKYKREDLIKLLEKLIKGADNHRKFWASMIREGRPFNNFNVFTYHLINKFTFPKYDKNRKLIYEEDGQIKMIKDWDLIIFVLLWIYCHIFNFPEIDEFLDSRDFQEKPTKEVRDPIRAWLQKKYDHFEPMDRWPLPRKLNKTGLQKIILTEKGYRGAWL